MQCGFQTQEGVQPNMGLTYCTLGQIHVVDVFYTCLLRVTLVWKTALLEGTSL